MPTATADAPALVVAEAIAAAAAVVVADANSTGAVRDQVIPEFGVDGGWRMSARDWRGIVMKWCALPDRCDFALHALTLPASAQEPGEKTFASPQDAAKALYKAVKADDKSAMLAVLGRPLPALSTPATPCRTRTMRDTFLKRFEQMNRWEVVTNGEQVLYIGADNWPFPFR